MDNRDKAIKEVRPLLKFDVEPVTLTEKFQNSVLRPILKLQNNLLLKTFQQYIKKRKGVFNTMDTIHKNRYIEQSLKSDTRLKQFSIGLIVGLFTLEELDLYIGNENEINRRINTMLIQRLQSQVEVL